MIKVILGEKGTGKTKALIDSVHQAVESEKGSVVFVSNSKEHMFNLDYRIRMVDTTEFGIRSFTEFYGLLCGIIAQNYDVSYIYVDSITKIAKGSKEELESLLDKIESLCGKFNIQLSMTISMKENDATEKIRAFAS